MKIMLANPRGFCAGVNRAIDIVERALEKFGAPSYVDNMLNKYFYFTKKTKNKNFYSSKIEYSYLFVFETDDKDNIINSEAINLRTEKKHRYKKEVTENNITKRGLLEKVFGGIGKNQLPNSP